ncbi:hypothetical protein [Georgenia sp. SUBG003]|uniref:hypothetical protein n=1 Tax=Georgenia sp. SUBG003 TaxID=1497974 RepID=UPI003AB2BAD9
MDRAGTGLVRRGPAQRRGQAAGDLAKLAGHGPVLMVVDQPTTIGALPLAVRRPGRCRTRCAQPAARPADPDPPRARAGAGQAPGPPDRPRPDPGPPRQT